MTHKQNVSPMLSVERELLESVVDSLEGAGLSGYPSPCEIQELRDLLDKPSAECKPFAWYRVPKAFPLQGAFFPYIEGQSEHDIQNSLYAEFGFNVKRLYDEPAAPHQGEPVAVIMPERMKPEDNPEHPAGKWAAEIYNSALDEVARLNGRQP